MTPAELREKLARELWARLEDCTQKEIIDATDIALRIIRETVRERLEEAMAAACAGVYGEIEMRGIIARWLAASPLRKPGA